MTLLAWQNKTSGVVPKDVSPTLRASGGTDIRKIPHVMYSRPHGYNDGRVYRYPCVRASAFDWNELLIGDDVIRRLTPLECERLQAFPDNWTKYGLFDDRSVRVISDTQRYRLIGNAVTTTVVTEIVKRLPDDVETYFDMFYGIKGFTYGIERA